MPAWGGFFLLFPMASVPAYVFLFPISRFIRSFGAKGKETGRLDQPRGVAVDANGYLYVADTGNHRVQVFNDEGEVVMVLGGLGSGRGKLRRPSGVAVDAQGNIYVADALNDRIQKFVPMRPMESAAAEAKAI